ncbi:hypothetical protein [Pseudomonas fulva]|uniref:hypothetical protein n=1 Tax=Pseudomonas fulva TaxID=47880 RepID=UPI0032F038EF
MPFTAESIIETFKETEVAGAPKLKHTQYLNYLAKRLGYQSFKHFTQCVETAPSDRLGDYYTGLMKKICGVRVPKQDIGHIRLSHFDGKSISYDSYFIGWDEHGREVRMPSADHGRLAIMDFREIFDLPLYVIETQAEFIAWQWNWASFAVAPPELVRANFPSLFNQRDRVVENPPMDKVKRRYRREQKKSGLI